MLNLFVLDAVGNKEPDYVVPAMMVDLQATVHRWTKWTRKVAQDMPNKVALCYVNTDELPGLMASR